jgi:hypothetical protein
MSGIGLYGGPIGFGFPGAYSRLSTPIYQSGPHSDWKKWPPNSRKTGIHQNRKTGIRPNEKNRPPKEEYKMAYIKMEKMEYETRRKNGLHAK